MTTTRKAWGLVPRLDKLNKPGVPVSAYLPLPLPHSVNGPSFADIVRSEHEPRADDDFLERLRAKVEAMKADGTLARIQARCEDPKSPTSPS
jgi:hypothetical protein